MPQLNLQFEDSVEDISYLLRAVRPVWAVPGELIVLSLPEFSERHAYQNREARALLLRVVDAANRIGLAPVSFSSDASTLMATALCADGALPGFEIVENDAGQLSVVPMSRPPTITLQ